jgi:hypothetical protein
MFFQTVWFPTFCRMLNISIGIKSLTQVVKIANADISGVTRISLNGTPKSLLAIIPGVYLYTNNQKLHSDNSNSKNCTRHRCKCSFIEILPQGEHAASEKQTNLLASPRIKFDAELQRNVAEFPLQGLQMFLNLKPEVHSIEKLHLIQCISSIRPSIHNAGNFAVWKSQIPL